MAAAATAVSRASRLSQLRQGESAGCVGSRRKERHGEDAGQGDGQRQPAGVLGPPARGGGQAGGDQRERSPFEQATLNQPQCQHQPGDPGGVCQSGAAIEDVDVAEECQQHGGPGGRFPQPVSSEQAEQRDQQDAGQQRGGDAREV